MNAPIPRERLERLAALLAEAQKREDRRICEGSLIEFFERAWPAFDPAPYTPGWHLGAIAEHLEAVNRGEIRRLLINIPPRCSKTSLVQVAWPAWTWVQGRNKDTPLMGPGVKFLCLTYAGDFALEVATTARRLIDSEWYQDRWGKSVQIARTMDKKGRFDTTAGGSRISTSFDGQTLGRGGDIKIIDDPHKVDDVESERIMPGVIKTYDEALSSRVTDPRHSAEVTIMQRLGESDLSGHILEQYEDCVHLCLPMRYEPERKCVTVLGFEDPRQERDELLWPARLGVDGDKFEAIPLISSFERNEYLWAGQYQQRPAPRGGGIIKRDWWQEWPDEKYPSCEYVLASLDTAYTEKQENDASALTIWGVFRDPNGNPKIILMYAWEGRLTIHDLVIAVHTMCSVSDKPQAELDNAAAVMGVPWVPRYPVDRLVIESKASGISVIQELERMYSGRGDFGVEGVDPSKWGDKTARLYAVQHLFSDGMVYAPDRKFADMVINNVSVFPKGAHDDLTDSCSLALRYLRLSGLLQRKEEYGRETQERLLFKPKERSLYW